MPVYIEGLKELRAAIEKLGNVENHARMKAALMDGADLVAVRARQKVPSRSGAAAKSIGPGITSRYAYVAGGCSPRYYGWLEFGTRTPRKGQPRKVGPWKHSGVGPHDGRFIYPAMNENAEKVYELVVNGLNTVIQEVWG